MSEATTGRWSIYLSGEIHSDWRDRIADGVKEAGLPVDLLAPVTDHAASDDVGADILGEETDKFWRDHKGAGVNAVRTQTLLRRADVVVVRFGEQYRQWTPPSTPATPRRSASRSSPSTIPSSSTP